MEELYEQLTDWVRKLHLEDVKDVSIVIIMLVELVYRYIQKKCGLPESV